MPAIFLTIFVELHLLIILASYLDLDFRSFSFELFIHIDTYTEV